MANRRRRRTLEWGKNLLIVLLSISALYLLGRTQFYAEGAASGHTWLSGLTASLTGREEEVADRPTGAWSQGGVPKPVRMVVISAQGRAGIQYDNAAIDRLFGELINPLTDALAGAQEPEPVSAAQFREALTSNRPGVYLDFLGEIPLTNLTAWLSGGRTLNGALTAPVRRLLLTVEGGEVLLYYINEETGSYYASKTDGSLAERLSAFTGTIPPNGAAFAFENGDRYAALAPYTLLEGTGVPSPGRYAVSNPVPLNDDGEGGYGDAFDALVRSLSFQPQSISYPFLNGVTVQEGAEKLRIYDSGKVIYESADLETPRFPLQGLSPSPTRWELVGSAWSFVEQVFQTTGTSPLCGAARLYIQGVEGTAGGGTAVLFGYQLDGAPVLVGEESWCARVEITGEAITSFSLKLRNYSYLEKGRSVLPELQATAALEARDGYGLELMLYYDDDLRSGELDADWGALEP